MPKIIQIGQCFTELMKKMIMACFYGPTLFFNSSIASCKNKEYLTAVFKH